MTGRSPKILIVDDSQEFVYLLETLLKEKDIEVFSEFSPEKALEVVSRESYELVVSDYMMERMDGITFIEKSKFASKNQDCEYILQTAKFLEDYELKKLESLGGKYLQKPIIPNELCQTILDIIKK